MGCLFLNCCAFLPSNAILVLFLLDRSIICICKVNHLQISDFDDSLSLELAKIAQVYYLREGCCSLECASLLYNYLVCCPDLA